jgi:DNA-binding MarR family transcriptional regulator
MHDKSDLPIALRAAYYSMHRRTDSDFAKFGITADQFVLLATLARGKVVTQRELAQRISSDPSTVRAMLVLLERQGLVERTSRPDDSRARSVSLTALGKRKFRQLWNVSESVRDQMANVFQPKELETLVKLLNRLSSSLTAEPTKRRAKKSEPVR